MELTIRNAMPEDAVTIAAIENACFSAPWSEKQIAEEIARDNAVFFVADQGGEVCGYVSAEDICGECYMGNLAVAPDRRRQRIGFALLQKLMEAAKSRGCVFLTLEVRESNLSARELYEKCGFSLVGNRKAFYEAPRENACIYTLYFKEEHT
ncbi:MAG: ribosomal protein S18-alanine N-acetyltransferase [Clostridia bacterium]|nr:ribosomal protein S18-alanine N-acetyltransferase [Clostridia bacterium]